MNRSLIAALCLTTALGTLNFAVAMDPQPPAQTGAPQPSPEEIKAFLTAARQGNLEIVKALLAKGHDVNAKDHDDYTALMWASIEGRLPVVQYLVEKDADVNVKDSMSGLTALMWAIRYGHLPIVQYLVEKGSDVHAKDKFGGTNLMTASTHGHLSVVQYLVEQKADVNAKDPRGYTALMHASRGGHLSIVQYLVDNGADANAKDNSGETALDQAKGGSEDTKQAVIDLLKNAMKDPDAIKKQKLLDAQVKALKDGGFLTDPAKAGMNAQELAEFKHAITCPISLDIMRDPVRTKTGTKNAQGQEQYTHAYEREDLEAWLKQSPQDPTTRADKNINDYEPDTDLAKRIQEFMDKHVPQEKP